MPVFCTNTNGGDGPSASALYVVAGGWFTEAELDALIVDAHGFATRRDRTWTRKAPFPGWIEESIYVHILNHVNQELSPLR